jgi:hypothetical protein
MKIIGLLFMVYPILTSNNIVNSQTIISYKESNNVTSSKEHINVPQAPAAQAQAPAAQAPAAQEPAAQVPVPNPPPIPQVMPMPIHIPIPSPFMNSNMLSPTCQNMF